MGGAYCLLVYRPIATRTYLARKGCCFTIQSCYFIALVTVRKCCLKNGVLRFRPIWRTSTASVLPSGAPLPNLCVSCLPSRPTEGPSSSRSTRSELNSPKTTGLSSTPSVASCSHTDWLHWLDVTTTNRFVRIGQFRN